VEEVNMEEDILMTRREYSVLKKKKEEDRCGWSEPNEQALVPKFIKPET
jgi:hypothetical protein